VKYLVRYLLASAILYCSSSGVTAQFTISTNLRPRLEFRDGYRTPRHEDTPSAFFVSQRTRLNIGFQNKKLKLFISPQDIRVWGSERQVGKDATFGLHEGWAQIFFSDKVSLKAGRQEFIYDGHRLLGNLDWVQQARSHDALLLKVVNNKFKADFAGAFNQSTERISGTDYRTDNYKVLVTAHLQNQYEKMKWSTIFVSDAYEKSETDRDLFWRYTLGASLGWFNSNLSLDGSVYWQGGKTRTEVDLAAFMFNLKAQYNFDKLAIAVGLDFISGDDSEDPDKYKAFSTLYPTNHKFYGFMDYYLNIPNDTKGGGLQDYFINFKYNTGSKSSLVFFYHQFLLANDVFDSSGNVLNSNLGGEIDLVFQYNIAAYAKLHIGASTYFANTTTEFIKGGDGNVGNYWGWMMITVTPEIFNSKSKE
jgi:alginate export protein